MDSGITQELRTITLTKIDEIKLVYFLNKTQLAFIDEGLTPTKDEGTWLRRVSMFRKEVH